MNNSEKIEEFVSLMRKRDFVKLKELLDAGFDPNSEYEVEESYSYDNGLIHGTVKVQYQLLDLYLCQDSPALQKLLRHYGGKTWAELNEEKRLKEISERKKREDEEEARKLADLAEVEKLISNAE